MISTHILDTARGRPASGVNVILELAEPGVEPRAVARAATDAEGRVRELLPGIVLDPGTYRLTFHTASYFATAGLEVFYPEVVVTFIVRDPRQHYHVPLIISPYGYTTYRGS